MPTVTSSYPPGSSLTHGENFDTSALDALRALAAAERQKGITKASPRRKVGGGNAGGMSRSGPGPMDVRMEMAKRAQAQAAIDEARARSAEARALSDVAPMKSIPGGPGMIGGVGRSGLQLDMSGMTGAQRKVLLPQDSRMGAIGDSGASLKNSDLYTGQPGRMTMTQNDAKQQAEREDRERGVSSHGYDYMNPIDQRAAFEALLRSSRDMEAASAARRPRNMQQNGYGVR